MINNVGMTIVKKIISVNQHSFALPLAYISATDNVEDLHIGW